MKKSTRMNTIVCLLVCVWSACLAMAAPLPVQSVQKDATSVMIKLASGVLRLEVCDERTIHVTCSSTDKLPKKVEFVVNRKWTPVPFELCEEPDKFILRTARVGVEINRATGVLTFTDAEGKTLLQELADGGRIITEVKSTTDAANKERTYRVQQTFLSPPDEYLYGMAQCQDGVWNWRGMPIELRQVNTQAALPMLISSRGYGLLWDNASLTDFNPVDREIQLSSSSDVASSDGPTATEQLRGRREPRGTARVRTGVFTTNEAGEYVFFVKDGDRRNEIGITVNGQTIAHIQNMWVPYTTVGKMSLPANSTCSVQLLGGGRNARIYARPLGNITTFRSHAAENIDYYFFYGPELDDIIAAYRNATGTVPLWPKWAYGFWQCRERYSSQQQIIDTVAEFRKRQIPIDLIVQDWQYWGPHGWGAYEWDTSQYPNPEELIQSLRRQNVKFMISVWSNPQGKAGADLKAHNYVIPGTDWVDVLNPAARELRWKYLNDAFFKIGTDAWWQDATEPGDDGNAMANHRVFLGSGDLYRNAYPLFANQTVYEGQRETSTDKRVCILTRSAFPGQQRYATALWSGDVAGNWETLRRQIPAGLNVCLTGLPYWTTDCGGFFRPRDQYQSEDYADLLIRWFQFSTFCPVQRMHGYQSETEFWKFPRAQETLIEYDRFRYRLLPYIYSIAWQVTHDGYTMMRALPMDFRGDPKVYDICDQYMFGPAFLVNPVIEPKAVSRSVYLPTPTGWTNFWTGKSFTSGERADVSAPQEVIPLFIRAGSIIPLGPYLQYSNEKPADPIELRIYPGANGSFTLYEDEGDSYRYEKGAYATIPIQWNETSQILTISKRIGEFPGMLKERTFHIIWVSEGHGVGITQNEKPDAIVRYTGDIVNVFLAAALQKTAFGTDGSPVTVTSPNGKIEIEIQTDTKGQLIWSVYRQDQLVLAPAPLGLTVDDNNLGQSAKLGEPRKRTINEQYPIWGNHSVAINHCNEAVIPVECADGMKYELELRAFDDGAAVRTHVVLDDTSHTIAGEATSWSLPLDSRAWWARYDYEQPCESGTFESIPGEIPLAPPVTFRLDESLYISLTEANNDSFPDMGLERKGNFLKAVFPASSRGWRQQGSIVTPWRVAIIAEGLNALVNSDIITNLCPPPFPELASADWIKPGRSLWHWWSIGAPRLNDQKEWVDAAKKLGFEYYLIDEGWRNWRSPGKDQWQCIKDVIDYGKTQGVGCIVWVNSSEMRTANSRRAYLEKVAALGAVGIKIDFIPACTAGIIRWYEGALKDTADLHLLCNFHGAVKPTGRRRTWPHELTREAVRGHEYHMTRYRRVQAADHDETVLFTRFLAGPADYTPTAFDLREMVGYTWAHLLAQGVNMTSPLLHFAGKYQDFIGNPAEDLLHHLPSTWDETIVLPGSEIGKTVGFARRRDQAWYIGVLNGSGAATLPIELSFLGAGTWQAEIFGDEPDNPATFKRESKVVKASDKLIVSMSPRGGTVVWITKIR